MPRARKAPITQTAQLSDRLKLAPRIRIGGRVAAVVDVHTDMNAAAHSHCAQCGDEIAWDGMVSYLVMKHGGVQHLCWQCSSGFDPAMMLTLLVLPDDATHTGAWPGDPCESLVGPDENVW